MAKDLWQFTGVTYDNRLITVEEEIDRSFSRSDAERLCKGRNGFKEIVTSSPISRPLNSQENNSNKKFGNNRLTFSGSNSSISNSSRNASSNVSKEDDFESGIWFTTYVFFTPFIILIGNFFSETFINIIFAIHFSRLGYQAGKIIWGEQIKERINLFITSSAFTFLLSISVFSLFGYYFAFLFQSQIWYVKLFSLIYIHLLWGIIFAWVLPTSYVDIIENGNKYTIDKKQRREIKKKKLKEAKEAELEIYNKLFYSSIYHITNYFESIEGIKKGATSKLFEDKIGKNIEYIFKIKRELEEIIPSEDFWKLIEEDTKLTTKYNIDEKSFIELLKLSKICIKKNIAYYSGNPPEVLQNWSQDQDKFSELIKKLKKIKPFFR